MAASSAARVARWRAANRVICPACGGDVPRLDELSGWCWICTRTRRREQERAQVSPLRASLELRRFEVSPLGYSRPMNGHRHFRESTLWREVVRL